jgi:hypothetical protein
MVFSICKQMKVKSVFLIPFIAFIFAALVFFLFLIQFNNYGSSQRLVQVIKFFENSEKGRILFIGDSQTREDIDCTLISAGCYNLGVAGILPTQLIFLKEKIISSKPKKVIIGVSPLFFNEEINMNLDYYYVLPRGNQSESTWQMLNDKEKSILSQNPAQKLVYKRKFILSFFINLIKPSNTKTENTLANFKQPFQYTQDQTAEEIDEKLNEDRILRVFRYENTEERQKDILLDLIRELKKSKIEVIVIQMPLNPKLLEKVNMNEFNSFMLNSSNELKFELKNYQRSLDKTSFVDLSHLNAKGRKELSDFIIGDKNII